MNSADAYTFSPSDKRLFVAHDIVSSAVLLVVIALYFAGQNLLIQDYMTGKILHIFGFVWFSGGLILATFAMSRYVWSQAALDHNKLADGYRFILVLELWCIPSIALLAYGGMIMINQIGGLEQHLWAYHGYLFLLLSPPALMIMSRLYHKKYIKGANIIIERSQRIAFWQDWVFIVLMMLAIGLLVVEMVQKAALF